MLKTVTAIVLLAAFLLVRGAVCVADESSYEEEEPLSEKVNEPTATLTQIQLQDQYTPGHTVPTLSRTRCSPERS